MNMTALLRGIARQLLGDGAISGEQYGRMIRRIEQMESGMTGSGHRK